MLVVRSIDSFETRDAPNVRIIKDAPCAVDITSGPVTYHPDDLPPLEEIPCVQFYSGRRAAEGRNPMVSICFSQEVREKLGVLLDIAIYPNKEIESLRVAAIKETARAHELKSDLEIAKRADELNHASLMRLSKELEHCERLLEGTRTALVAANEDYLAASDDLRTAALLTFWQRLKFLLGWSLRDLVEATNKRATPKRLTDDTPPETDASAAPSRGPATD